MPVLRRFAHEVVWLVSTLMIAVVLAGAAPAFAQGSFYQEVAKDGRIYVFNQMKVYDEWVKGGEMGKSITRVGAGPNGETLVFDSVEAIHLYNFKHGLPGEVILVPEEKKPLSKVSWKDGKTTIDFDNAQINITNRIQVLFRDEQPGDPNNHESKGSFRIRRARTKLDGWIYSKNLTYDVEADWAEAGGKILLESALNYDTTRGKRGFMIRGGQFKTPFSRQFLTSSGSLQLVDRSIVTTEFAKEYDIGLQLWGQTPQNKIEWRGGMFNGADRNATTNDNNKYEVDGRVMWNIMGDVKYSESDFETTDRPMLAIAAKYNHNNLHGATAGNDPDREIFGGDLSFKFKGFSLLSEYYQRKTEPEVGIDFDSTGYYVQAGYFLYKRYVEIAARFSMIDPRDNTVDAMGVQVPTIANDHLIERVVGVNWFMNKHPLKLQTDYTQVENELLDRTDDMVRVQMQFAF